MANAAQITTGRCLCGDIRYEFQGAPAWVLHCHCDSCRRHTAAPVASFVCVERGSLRFTEGEPAVYRSSPGVRRSFCGRCGSPIAYEADRVPDEVHLYLGTLADAAAIRPEGHVHAAEQLAWFEVEDALPRWARGRRGGAAPVRIGPRQP